MQSFCLFENPFHSEDLGYNDMAEKISYTDENLEHLI